MWRLAGQPLSSMLALDLRSLHGLPCGTLIGLGYRLIMVRENGAGATPTCPAAQVRREGLLVHNDFIRRPGPHLGQPPLGSRHVTSRTAAGRSDHMSRFVQALGFLWALPWTLLGLGIGVIGLATGGSMRRRAPVLQFYGGAVSWLLERFPGRPIAMTLGHVVLGQNETALDVSHQHELVHVRQYQRWGPLFIPAYLLCSLALWLAGKDAYRDNPFEREAYGTTGR
jgi:hypothetical protein